MAASTVYAIRAHRDSPAVRRLHAELSDAMGPESVLLVVDELKGKADWPATYSRIAVTPALLGAVGLEDDVPEAGWLCGDYSYYALAHTLPFDYAWMVEPDVRFANVNLGEFFSAFAQCDLDFLARGVAPAGDWYWRPFLEARGIRDVWRCHFALTRASRPAIAAALGLRRRVAACATPRQIDHPNDESVFATAVAAAGLRHGDLLDFHPGHYRYYSFDMKFHGASVLKLCEGPQVIHGALAEDEYVEHVRCLCASMSESDDGSRMVRTYRNVRMIAAYQRALHSSDCCVLRHALPKRYRFLVSCGPLLDLVCAAERRRHAKA